jgi:hypothetical protein
MEQSRRSLFGWLLAALGAAVFGRSVAIPEPELPELMEGPVFGYPPLELKPEWQELAFAAPDEFKFYRGFETLTLQGVPIILDGGFPMLEPGDANARHP